MNASPCITKQIWVLKGVETVNLHSLSWLCTLYLYRMFVLYTSYIYIYYAACLQSPPIWCDGDAQPLWQHSEQHWCWPCWWSWGLSWQEYRTSVCPVWTGSKAHWSGPCLPKHSQPHCHATQCYHDAKTSRVSKKKISSKYAHLPSFFCSPLLSLQLV